MAHSGKTITFATDLLPQEDNTYNLGKADQAWKFYGNLTGNATNVTGTVAIANGGTGKTTAAEAWTALGGGDSGKHADSYFALASHGNHVPTTQTANNITFLRNDNSWYKLTRADVSTLINLLDTGSSDLTANDYVITQYVNGGTTTTTYHRRPASKVINATLVKAALGTDNSTTNKWLNQKGQWSTPTAAQVGAATSDHDHDGTYVKLSGSSDINIIYGDTDKFLNFKYSTNSTVDNNWRTGVLGTGSGDTNYYVIQSGGANNSSGGTWNTTLRIGQQTYDTGFGGNVYPITTATNTLGTSTNKWSEVYANEFIGNIKTDKIIPIISKTYPSYTCSADSAAKGWLFFGKINITDTTWQMPWSIHYRLYVSTSEAVVQGWYDCYFSVHGSTVNYYNYNNFYSTSNRPIYNHVLMYPKNTYTSYGGYIGARIQSAYLPTSLGRIFKIEILEMQGCTITLNDEIKRYDETYIKTNNIAASTIWYITEYNGTALGLQESGDTNSNDTSTTYERYSTTRVTCTTLWPRYSLAFTHPTDSTKVIPVNTTENTTADTKSTITSAEFNIFDKIYYKSDAPSTVLAANSLAGASVVWYAYCAIDLRYSFNLTTTSLTPHADVYLVCNLVSPTTATIRGYDQTGSNASTLSNNLGPITQTLPSTEDGLIYIKLGKSYSAYQIALMADHPIYWYKDGAIQEYNYYAAVAGSVDWVNVNGHPTNLNEFTNGPGYVTSSGVTSITLKAGAGITLDTDNTAITSTGTRTISISGINTSSGSETTCLTAKGTWKAFNNYSLSIAKNDTLGGVKPWYSHTAASTGPTTGSNSTAVTVNEIQTTSGRYYAIESDSNGRLFVNVPWTNVNSSYLTTHNNLVKQTAKTDNVKYKLLASAQSSPSSGTAYEAIYDAKVYVNPSLNTLNAGGFVVHDKASTPVEKIRMEWNATDLSLDFIFV